GAHHERKPYDGHGNTEVIATPMHDSGENIAAILIETAQVRQGGAALGQGGVALGWTIRRDPRRQQGYPKPKKPHQPAQAEERGSAKRPSDRPAWPGESYWKGRKP